MTRDSGSEERPGRRRGDEPGYEQAHGHSGEDDDNGLE